MLTLFCSVHPSSIRGLATPRTYFLHLSLSSIILIYSSTGSPVHVLMLSIQAVLGCSICSGINWTICKQSAPRCRQITTPRLHHSIFTCRMLFQTPNQQRWSTECNIKLLDIRLCHSYVFCWLAHEPMSEVHCLVFSMYWEMAVETVCVYVVHLLC